MKKLIVLLVVCTPILSFAQRKPKIKGNRSVIEVKEDLPAFNAIELTADLDIQLNKSFGEGYEIIADDNLIDVLKFKVKDSTLVISSFYTITAKKKLEILINYKDLKAITQYDGKIEMLDVLSTENLYVNTYGSSKLSINISAFVANLNMEDNSSGNLNFDVDSLNVSLKHKSKVDINSVSSTKNIELLNSASLNINGTTDSLNLKMHNNTKFVGQNLKSGIVKIQLEESGSARVNAFRELELISKGNSKTYLYGDPKITILEFLDTSQLIKKKN